MNLLQTSLGDLKPVTACLNQRLYIQTDYHLVGFHNHSHVYTERREDMRKLTSQVPLLWIWSKQTSSFTCSSILDVKAQDWLFYGAQTTLDIWPQRPRCKREREELRWDFHKHTSVENTSPHLWPLRAPELHISEDKITIIQPCLHTQDAAAGV